MPSVISGDANVSATEFGYLDGVTSALQTQMDSKLPLAGGKILQIVRATDSTQRSTTSTSFVDVTGVTVSITPQKSDSAVILLVIGEASAQATSSPDTYAKFIITDSSNNSLSGSSGIRIGMAGNLGSGTDKRYLQTLALIAYATPATTSAVTYKCRFKVDDSAVTARLDGASIPTEMYAIEVSA